MSALRHGSLEVLTEQDKRDYFGEWVVSEHQPCRGTGCEGCDDEGVIREWVNG